MANYTLTKGSTVEVTIDDPGFHGAWYVATLVDEVEASPTRKNKRNRKRKKTGYLVKYDTLLNDDGNHQLTEVVDPSAVRPSPPRNIRLDNAKEAEVAVAAEEGEGDGGGDFEVDDVIDAYHRDGWWIGMVKSVINEGEMRKYVVSFENPPEEFEFDRSKVRLHVDWVDGRWVIPPKKAVLGDKNATEDALSGFSTPSEGAQIIETNGPSCSAKKNTRTRSRERSGSKSAVGRPRRRRLQPSADSKGSTKVIVLEDVDQDSPPVEHEIIITQARDSEDGTSHQKRKWRIPPELVVKKPTGLLEGSSSLSPPDHHDNSLNKTAARTTTDYQQDWPFIKRSPMWVTIELYSQKPHFAPLKEIKEDYREGLAIAQFITFENLFQRLSDLKPNDPADIFTTSLETLGDLETHGFDVGPIRGRLNQLLSLKTKMCQQDDKRKEVEKELEKCNNEKSLVEKEIDELKEKMQALKSKSVQIAIMQKAKEKELMRLQSTNDLEADFEMLATTPL